MDFLALSFGMKPANLFVPAQPRELTLGQPARVSLHQMDRFFKAHPPHEKQPHVPIADATERIQIAAITFLESPLTSWTKPASII